MYLIYFLYYFIFDWLIFIYLLDLLWMSLYVTLCLTWFHLYINYEQHTDLESVYEWKHEENKSSSKRPAAPPPGGPLIPGQQSCRWTSVLREQPHRLRPLTGPGSALLLQLECFHITESQWTWQQQQNSIDLMSSTCSVMWRFGWYWRERGRHGAAKWSLTASLLASGPRSGTFLKLQHDSVKSCWWEESVWLLLWWLFCCGCVCRT